MCLLPTLALSPIHMTAPSRLCSPEDIERMRDCMVEVSFNENEFVFEQGDEGDALYVLLQGTAEVRATGPLFTAAPPLHSYC